MQSNSLWFLAICLLGCVSCDKKQTIEEKQKQIETGTLDAARNYTASEIGWTTKIPEDWNVMTAKEKANLNQKGLKAVEGAAGPIDASGLKELVNLRKDKFNSFLSTIEAYDAAANGPWMENQANIVKIIESAFAQAGVKMGKTVLGKETVDGLEFETVKFTILHPKSGELLMTQTMYTRLIHGYDFAMTICHNNDADYNALLGMVQSSKFSLRD